MKKLMFALAAAACATVGFAEGEITSQNIVGYNTITLDASDGESANQSFGMSFVPVSSTSFTLDQLKPDESTFSTDSDFVQKIDANTLECSAILQYCTAARAAELAAGTPGSKAEDFIGWWDMMAGTGAIGDPDAYAGGYTVNVGDGFMGSFYGGNAIKFQSAGEAPTTATTITMAGGEEYNQMFCNYIPKTLKLKQIVPQEGTFDTEGDFVQIIDPKTLEASAILQYCTVAKATELAAGTPGSKAEDFIGWWDMMAGTGMIGDPNAYAGDYDVKEGAGFMGSFYGGTPIVFQFPSSTATVD